MSEYLCPQNEKGQIVGEERKGERRLTPDVVRANARKNGESYGSALRRARRTAKMATPVVKGVDILFERPNKRSGKRGHPFPREDVVDEYDEEHEGQEVDESIEEYMWKPNKTAGDSMEKVSYEHEYIPQGNFKCFLCDVPDCMGAFEEVRGLPEHPAWNVE